MNNKDNTINTNTDILLEKALLNNAQLEKRISLLEFELVSIRKVHENDKEQYNLKNIRKIIPEFLEVKDNLERTMEILHTQMGLLKRADRSQIGSIFQTIIPAIEILDMQMKNAFSQNNISKIELNIGDEFDEEKHHIISTVDGEEDNKVVEIIKDGYIDNKNNLIRRAMVIISLKNSVNKE